MTLRTQVRQAIILWKNELYLPVHPYTDSPTVKDRSVATHFVQQLSEKI
jgi:hypothetical protein